MAVRARELLGEGLPRGIPLFVDEVDLHDAAGEAERRLDRVGDAAEDVGARDEAVDDDGDVVLVGLLEDGRLGELDELAVDDRARVALGAELLEEVDELALLLGDDGRDDLVPGALGQLHELVGDLLHRLALDDLAALRAVRHADARPQQAHVVVDLGDRADRRARVAVGRLLVDRHRGAQALDEVDVGPVDLTEELARVGAQRLDVAALALGEDRVERETRLARAGQAGEDDERVARDVEVDVLEIVDAGAADAELSARPGFGRVWSFRARRQGRWAPDKSRRGLRHSVRQAFARGEDDGCRRPAARGAAASVARRSADEHRNALGVRRLLQLRAVVLHPDQVQALRQRRKRHLHAPAAVCRQEADDLMVFARSWIETSPTMPVGPGRRHLHGERHGGPPLGDESCWVCRSVVLGAGWNTSPCSLQRNREARARVDRLDAHARRAVRVGRGWCGKTEARPASSVAATSDASIGALHGDEFSGSNETLASVARGSFVVNSSDGEVDPDRRSGNQPAGRSRHRRGTPIERWAKSGEAHREGAEPLEDRVQVRAADVAAPCRVSKCREPVDARGELRVEGDGEHFVGSDGPTLEERRARCGSRPVRCSPSRRSGAFEVASFANDSCGSAGVHCCSRTVRSSTPRELHRAEHPDVAMHVEDLVGGHVAVRVVGTGRRVRQVRAESARVHERDRRRASVRCTDQSCTSAMKLLMVDSAPRFSTLAGLPERRRRAAARG